MPVELAAMVGRLRANAEVLASLAAGVSDEQAGWKPRPDKWSILEVVNHLADEEVEDFRPRLDLTLHQPGKPWPPIDPQGWVTARGYDGRDLHESLERFLAARRGSLAWLEGVKDPDWSLAYEHPKAGPITAGDVLTSWVAHDHIHIRQLNRLHREYLAGVLSPHSPEYAGRW
ncbi:MAG TPA: DinB family protein [Longimicrobiales bacterium]|nr:DinB family protein [Longimicrobiales bacterium]